ncbi:hypothetical protein O181_110699 [Austropuccinia psidii MF-1]|uniref:Uncharacterized protein n=1 Tax=Austropuccinia psidii MF-1 TaxID=1389203 RepID=A0A9Q3K0J1_9BASI|nr:hypothetical protein [Austropuccinia psidii MF-1]
MAFWGHLGPLPPLWPTVPVRGTIRPLLAKSNEAKRCQGGSSSAPKARWGPPEPLCPQWPNSPEMASGSHQRPPAQLQARIPLSFRGRLFLPQCTLHSRMQEWCIYGIRYHYAPFLLRNTMVMLSGPNYMIPNQDPNPSPISKDDF